MKITYIHHSSFLVELEQAMILFDYFEGELPKMDSGKPLFVFASHRHGDHFSPVIFELAKAHENIRYILSDDIWKKRVPEALQEKATFMGAGERQCFSGGTSSGFEITVKTLRSTDEGVAFIIEAEGKTIYHAGDLNDWVWEGEPEANNRRMSENYRREMEKLKDVSMDIAFVVLDPRQEKDFALGMKEFMESAKPKAVFPMHFWGDFGTISRFKALPETGKYRDKIYEIHKKGEEFLL